MKKFILHLLITCLLITTTLFIVGCGKEKDNEEENVATGNFTYELVTLDDDEGVVCYDENGNAIQENGEDKKYTKYYKITGFTISKEDKEKIDNGDFSTTSKYFNITLPKTYTELKDKDGKALTEDLPIREISFSAFASNKIFREVVVPNNYAKIGDGAFSGVVNLQKITLPFVGESKDAKNEKRLFGYIFGTVSQDSGVTACDVKPNLDIQADGSDLSSSSTTTFYIPNTLKEVVIVGGEIEDCAFYNMKTLKSITIPNVKTIEPYAFYKCSSLEKFIVPENVETIYQRAFSGCSSLYDIKFNDLLTDVKEYAFEDCSKLCSNLISDVVLDLNNIVTIGEYAFKNCTSIKIVDLSNISIIEKGLFSGCSSLKNVTLKSGYEAIKDCAFTGCKDLKKANVTNIQSSYNELAFDEDFD